MLTPNQLAKSGTESAHQIALFAYCAVAYHIGFPLANKWADKELTFEQAGVLAGMKYGINPVIPELKWLHHIPNGGSRGDDAKSRAIRGGQLKAEGVRVGVSDLSLPVARGGFSGLYIELKRIGGKASPEQLEFGAFVQAQGFRFEVCEGWQAARDVLIDYLTR